MIRLFFQFSDTYPWAWTPTLVDDWSADLVHQHGFVVSTTRNYQQALRLFTEYLTSPFYDWSAVCEERFGTHPTQCCHEWNTTAHLTEYEADPRRRPFTRAELQRFFDHADDQVARSPAGPERGVGRLPGRDAVQGGLRVGAVLRGSARVRSLILCVCAAQKLMRRCYRLQQVWCKWARGCSPVGWWR